MQELELSLKWDLKVFCEVLETGSLQKVSSNRLEKPGIESTIPDLEGKRFIYYTTTAAKGSGETVYKQKHK